MYFKLLKKTQNMRTCDWMDLDTLGFLADYAQKSP